MVLNLVALHRQPRVVAAIVAGHIIVFQAKNEKSQPKPQILITVKAQATCPEALGFGEIGRFLDPRRNIGADVAHRHTLNRGNERHFHKIDS